ncbi:MAG: Gfo/Idh/MocA family oxidoreductase [Planctomycetes bacterium]|nr:Gfo/Idh/MocA family oxidoreductase [Planctomycetota bacterium]
MTAKSANPIESHLTRRDFVKATAGLAATSVAAGALPARAWAFAGGTDRIKVGLIGCGGRGTGAADQALAADPGTVLWAMGDAFKDRLDGSLASLGKQMQEKDAGESAGSTKWKDKLQVAEDRRFVGFDAYLKVIESGVDVVLLASTPVFRPIHLRAAIEAGKHVFCEKPMAVDAPGVRSILETVAMVPSKKVSLVGGFCWRYSDAERATWSKIHEGAIGDVRAIWNVYNTDGWAGTTPRKPGWSDMEWQLRNWHYFYWLSGDHLVEQAIHSIDKIAWTMKGELPTSCVAVGGRQCRAAVPETGNVFDHFGVEYEFASGARAFHMCHQMANTPFDNSDTILGTKGTCLVNSWAPSHVIDGETKWTYDGPRRNMYQNEHDALMKSIRDGKPINDGVAMANSTMMAIQARLAAYTGQVVTWDQAMQSQENLTPKTWAWGPVTVAPVPKPGVTKLS